MGKLIVTNIVSLDGYYEGPGGNVMVLPMDQGFDAYNVERLREADTLLLGRNSYELFKGFWLFGFQRGVTVARRSQLGRPA